MPEITQETKAIQLRNDDIRGRLPSVDPDDRLFVTQGIMALGPEALADALRQTKAQTEFEPGNDPYGEHDFGVFELFTGDKCFWKIDDYRGHDGIRCVLTILLADEY